MKKVFLVVVLLLSLEISKESDSIKNNLKAITKCFLNTKSNRDTMISIFEKIFTFKNIYDLLTPLSKLILLIKECTGKEINIFEIIKLNSEPKIPEVLNKIKNFNAPILLRKYLYDFISKNGLEYAKNECLSLISEKPFIQYKRICSLL